MVTVVAIENSKAAEMNASSTPAFLTTTKRAKRRAKTARAARMVVASVTPVTAEPGAWPDIDISDGAARYQERADGGECVQFLENDCFISDL